MMRICALAGVLAITVTVMAVVMMHYLYRDPLLCVATALGGIAMTATAMRCVARRAANDGLRPLQRRDTIRALCDEDEEELGDDAGHGARIA